MKSKRIISSVCAVALVCSMSLTAWAQPAEAAPNITSAQTPVSSTAVEQKWANKYISTSAWGESASCGTPVAVGDYIYTTDSDACKLLKLDAKTGATVRTADCKQIPPYFSKIAYGDGKIYVPQQDDTSKTVRISAFDADTLALVWQSEAFTNPKGGSEGLQISAPIVYYNQRIYFGTYVQDSSYAYVGGAYICLGTADGKTAWQYKNTLSGYYYGGGAVAGSAILVGDCAGKLASFDLTTGALLSSVDLGGAVMSTPCYAQGRAYVSLAAGDIASVPVTENGAFDGAAKKTVKVGDNVTSSPVVYNGRLYVAGGGYNSTAPFSVIDADTMQIIYQISSIRSQSAPLLSTAYATSENKQQVYIYVTNYFSGSYDSSTYQSVYNPDSSCVYVIKDSAGQTEPSYEELAAPSVLQYCSQSVTASDAGWLYYYNDSGNLFAFAPKAAPASNNTSSIPAPVSSQTTDPAQGVSSDAGETVSRMKTPPTGDRANSTAFLCLVVTLACAGAVLVLRTKKKA